MMPVQIKIVQQNFDDVIKVWLTVLSFENLLLKRMLSVLAFLLLTPCFSSSAGKSSTSLSLFIFSCSWQKTIAKHEIKSWFQIRMNFMYQRLELSRLVFTLQLSIVQGQRYIFLKACAPGRLTSTLKTLTTLKISRGYFLFRISFRGNSRCY